MPLKKFYTSYDHNQGIHKVCLTSLIMSVKKLESYDMSNAIYLEKRVGGEKHGFFSPPVSNIFLISYDVMPILAIQTTRSQQMLPKRSKSVDQN